MRRFVGGRILGVIRLRTLCAHKAGKTAGSRMLPPKEEVIVGMTCLYNDGRYPADTARLRSTPYIVNRESAGWDGRNLFGGHFESVAAPVVSSAR